MRKKREGGSSIYMPKGEKERVPRDLLPSAIYLMPFNILHGVTKSYDKVLLYLFHHGSWPRFYLIPSSIRQSSVARSDLKQKQAKPSQTMKLLSLI